jgi:DNA-binding response OmpR family regulator
MAQRAQHILVVEDDPAIADLIVWVLADAGFTVYSAPTVSRALALYERIKPDVVVADLMLPDGMGSHLLQQLQQPENQPSAATLVMSALPRARQYAADVQADAYLPKPFDLDDLLDIVHRLVARATSHFPPDGEGAAAASTG